MSDMPDPAATLHVTHDRELVAACAAGDVTGADLERVRTLVAGCAACAELHRDLRLIAAALPAIPAPVRPRDFRLAPEVAATLRRPSGLRRLLAPLASARFAFAGPVGASLAALGIAGILLSGTLTFGGATAIRDTAAGPAGLEAAPVTGPGADKGSVDVQATAAPAAAEPRPRRPRRPPRVPSWPSRERPPRRRGLASRRLRNGRRRRHRRRSRRRCSWLGSCC